jgi:hypothetical protein
MSSPQVEALDDDGAADGDAGEQPATREEIPSTITHNAAPSRSMDGSMCFPLHQLDQSMAAPQAEDERLAAMIRLHRLRTAPNARSYAAFRARADEREGRRPRDSGFGGGLGPGYAPGAATGPVGSSGAASGTRFERSW